MPATAQAMRLDPWAAEYEGSIQIGDDVEPASVDVKVEQDEWKAVRPGARKTAPRMAFGDGVRQLPARHLRVPGIPRHLSVEQARALGAVLDRQFILRAARLQAGDGRQQKVLSAWQDDPKAPDAMLNIASSQEALGDRRGAQKTLEALLAKHPASPAAASAKQRLAQGPKR